MRQVCSIPGTEVDSGVGAVSQDIRHPQRNQDRIAAIVYTVMNQLLRRTQLSLDCLAVPPAQRGRLCSRYARRVTRITVRGK